MKKINLEICGKCEACDFFVVFKYRDYSGRVELQGQKKTKDYPETICRNSITSMMGIKSPAMNFAVNFKWLQKYADRITYDAEMNKFKCPHYLEYLLLESDKETSDDK